MVLYGCVWYTCDVILDGFFRSRGPHVPKMYREQDDMLARSTIETWVIKAEKGDPNACPKCDGKVFEAEKMVTATVSLFCFVFMEFYR